jgi:hypothetical protein
MKLSRKSLGHWILSSTAALLATAVLGSTAMADTFYVSSTATAGTYSGGSYTGGGTGTLANPFGSIVEAYRAAYLDPNASTIQLEDGTYSGAHIGSAVGWGGANGGVGVVNLGGDGYFGVGAPAASSPSITIQGNLSNPNAVTISGTGYTAGAATGLFRAQNAYETGLTIQDVKIDTTGAPELFGSMTFQGFAVKLANDAIKLGTSVAPSDFYYENSQIPPPTAGGFTFADSTIQLGYSSNRLGEVWQNYNGGQGPNADIFDGTNTSSIYDSSGNLVTNLSDLFLVDRSGPPYGTYQNGVNYWTPLGPAVPEFAQNFDTEAPPPVAVPEPSSIVALCGMGLAGLFVAARRRRARVAAR